MASGAGRPGARAPPSMSFPLYTPGDLRKHFIGQFDRMIADNGKPSNEMEPGFLHVDKAAIEMGRQIKNPGTRREVDKWVMQDAKFGNRSVPFTGNKTSGDTVYVALVPGTDENGNNVYSARIINGRYIFTKDIAYRTLTYDEMEEQRKNPKKQRRFMLKAKTPADADESKDDPHRIHSRFSDDDNGSDAGGEEAIAKTGYRNSFKKEATDANKDDTGLVSEGDSDDNIFGEGMADYDAARSDDSDGDSDPFEDLSDDDDGEEVDVLLDDDEAANAYSKSGSQMKSLLEKSAKAEEEEMKAANAALANAKAMTEIGQASVKRSAAAAPRVVVESRRPAKRARSDQVDNAAKEELIASFVAVGGRMSIKDVAKLAQQFGSKFPALQDANKFKALLRVVADHERTTSNERFFRLKPAMWKLFKAKHAKGPKRARR